MADDSVVPIDRFFCHKCSREISVILSDFRCPTCQCGFIEVLESDNELLDDSSDSEVGGVGGGRQYDIFSDMMMSITHPDRWAASRSRRSGRTGRARQAPPLEHFIQDFMVNLSGWGSQVSISQRGPNAPPFLFLGNPGDYAWGREGLDAIVTQLLNQMDSAGPPPLAQEKINEIPTVGITQEQADMNIQCSVCWEDFKLSEQVRKLACEHIFHHCCIVPWLELHGTCPICRKALSEEVAAESTDNANNPIGNQLATLFRVANQSVTDTDTPSTSSSSGTGTTSSSSSSLSSRPDFHMDMEFD